MAQAKQQGPPSAGPPKPGEGMGRGLSNSAPQETNVLLAGSGTGGGVAQVVGALQAKDRDAIRQFQSDKSPPEYAPMVQQYLKNIADASPRP
jgi:hypothetical protein